MFLCVDPLPWICEFTGSFSSGSIKIIPNYIPKDISTSTYTLLPPKWKSGSVGKQVICLRPLTTWSLAGGSLSRDRTRPADRLQSRSDLEKGVGFTSQGMIRKSFYQSVYLSTCLSVCLLFYLLIYRSTYYLSIYLSVCLAIYLPLIFCVYVKSTYLSIYLQLLHMGQGKRFCYICHQINKTTKKQCLPLRLVVKVGGLGFCSSSPFTLRSHVVETRPCRFLAVHVYSPQSKRLAFSTSKDATPS